VFVEHLAGASKHKRPCRRGIVLARPKLEGTAAIEPCRRGWAEATLGRTPGDGGERKTGENVESRRELEDFKSPRRSGAQNCCYLTAKREKAGSLSP